jgi:hypothetical protein
MSTQSLPSIDEKNPLYCPAVPAAVYLDSLRRYFYRNERSRSNKTHNDGFLRSFARLLDNALLSSDTDDEDVLVFPPKSQMGSSHRNKSSPDTSDDNPLGYQYDIPSWEHEDANDISENPWVDVGGRPVPMKPPGLRILKRKRISFSDMRGPAKHAKSFQAVQESSFDITVKHEKLRYSGFAGSRPRTYLKTIEPSAESTPRNKPVRKCNVRKANGQQLRLRIRTLEGAQISKSGMSICAPTRIYPSHRRTLRTADRD